MRYDTAGNPLYENRVPCDCGLTAGCKKCNPMLDPNYHSKRDIKNIIDDEFEELLLYFHPNKDSERIKKCLENIINKINNL